MLTFIKWSFLVLVACVAIMVTGCMPVDGYRQSIYSDDSEIVKEGDTFSYKHKVSGDTLQYDDFTGMETMWQLNMLESESIDFDVTSTVSKGQFKCVLITPADEVHVLPEQDKTGVVTLSLPAGKNRIKIVGKRASGEFALILQAAIML